MAESEYYGMYDYMGFTIWCPNEKEWIAEPNWDIESLEKLKPYLPRHKTITQAKNG